MPRIELALTEEVFHQAAMVPPSFGVLKIADLIALASNVHSSVHKVPGVDGTMLSYTLNTFHLYPGWRKQFARHRTKSTPNWYSFFGISPHTMLHGGVLGTLSLAKFM